MFDGGAYLKFQGEVRIRAIFLVILAAYNRGGAIVRLTVLSVEPRVFG